MDKKENIEIALGAICYIGLVIYAVVVKKICCFNSFRDNIIIYCWSYDLG
jgi:hypothetical protein